MNVKTRLQISAALPIILAVVTAGILYQISEHVWDAVPKLVTANGISREAARLDQATFRYLLSPDEGSRTAWVDAHRDLNQFLLQNPTLSDEDNKTLELLRTRHEETTEIFRTLSEHVTASATSGVVPNDTLTRELLGKILERTRSMVFDSQPLAANANYNALNLQERSYLLIILVATILAGVLAALSLVLISRVIGGVESLKGGMAAIGKDNVDHRVTADGADEMTELARGFNKMAEEISSTRKNLKDEIAEKEKVAQSLRQSNVELSAAFEKLQRAQNDVLRRERADALRQIARGIVHDINDALMPLQGLSDLYIHYPDQLKDTKDVQEAFVTVHAASERIATTVKNIASFCAPTKAPGKARIDLAALVQEVVSSTEPFWKAQKQAEGLTIVMKTELGAVPAFDADKADLIDSLRALITNAVEAMPAGGTVLIRTRREGSSVIIEVSDSGEGMDSALKARVFEPFFSTKAGHSGMGLTAVQGAITRATGELSLESIVGKGTTVRLSIPMETGAVAAKVTSAAPVLSRKLQILTVDDEPWSIKVLTRHLSIDGHHTDACSTGQTALDLLRKRSFDLVIIDRAMPDISGDVLAQEIKILQPAVPILMLTGFGGLMADDSALPSCVDRVISKPVDLKDLRDAIASVVATRS
jgi:signal transduction histidine kinase